VQRRIVELQFLKRLTQRIVLIRLDGIKSGKNLRFDFLESRQRFQSRVVSQRHRIADLGRLEFFNA
jgi:hypothetical protein